MASYLVTTPNGLYLESVSGAITSISLPSGVSITSGALCRPALFGTNGDPYIVVVNGLSSDIYIDKSGIARTLQLQPPAGAPAVTTGAGTDLTGVYKVAVTFKIKDGSGKLVAESALSPLSTGSVSLSNVSLAVNSIPVSNSTDVNARGLYRTLSGGNVLYPWFDIDDNTTTSEDRGGSDANISLLPTTATTIGLPPLLSLIMAWKDRLWGVPRLNPDFPQWTESLQFYAWNATNQIVAPPQNTDPYGVLAFIPRRDQLGIARRNRLYQITGDSNDTFARTEVSPNIGCLSQESVVVVRDVAYWLGERGVVEWTSQSLMYVSESQVDAWFTTDNFFNRGLFGLAQGRYNPDTDSYELLMAGLGSTSLNMWVSFDLKRRAWFGPHTTDLPLSCCATDTERHGYLRDAGQLPMTAFGGGTGILYKRDSTVADDDNNPVEMDLTLPLLGTFAPEMDKVWLDPTLHSRIEPASTGSNTVTITAAVGSLNADGIIDDANPVVSEADLTEDFQRLDRPGEGRYVSFRFQHAAQGERVRIFGLEVPYNIIGRRGR